MPWDWEGADFVVPQTVPWKLMLDPGDLPVLLLGFCPSMRNSETVPINVFGEAEKTGEPLTTQIFMSTSTNPKVKASEDKWFVYALGPDRSGSASLHMHRSWTGHKVISLQIQASNFDAGSLHAQPASITSITWETSSEKFGLTGEQDAKETAITVCGWVLNVTAKDSVAE
jgi:hypothetical protein